MSAATIAASVAARGYENLRFGLKDLTNVKLLLNKQNNWAAQTEANRKQNCSIATLVTAPESPAVGSNRPLFMLRQQPNLSHAQ
jgi:hypothetical protein